MAACACRCSHSSLNERELTLLEGAEPGRLALLGVAPPLLRFGAFQALFLGMVSLWTRKYTHWLYEGALRPIFRRGWFRWIRFHTSSVGVRGVFCGMEFREHREKGVLLRGG